MTMISSFCKRLRHFGIVPNRAARNSAIRARRTLRRRSLSHHETLEKRLVLSHFVVDSATAMMRVVGLNEYAQPTPSLIDLSFSGPVERGATKLLEGGLPLIHDFDAEVHHEGYGDGMDGDFPTIECHAGPSQRSTATVTFSAHIAPDFGEIDGDTVLVAPHVRAEAFPPHSTAIIELTFSGKRFTSANNVKTIVGGQEFDEEFLANIGDTLIVTQTISAAGYKDSVSHGTHSHTECQLFTNVLRDVAVVPNTPNHYPDSFYWNTIEDGGGFYFTYSVVGLDNSPVSTKIDFSWLTGLDHDELAYSFVVDSTPLPDSTVLRNAEGVHRVNVRFADPGWKVKTPPKVSILGETMVAPELTMTIDPDRTLQETDEINNYLYLPVVPIVVNVVTHGYNPRGYVVGNTDGFLEPFVTGAAKLEAIPKPGSMLDNRDISYVPDWDSTSKFGIGFAALMGAELDLGARAALIESGATDVVTIALEEYYLYEAKVLIQVARSFAESSDELLRKAARRIERELLNGTNGLPPLLDRSAPSFQHIQLIGHSRGAGLNVELARMLYQDGFRNISYTALDGYGNDWPAGLVSNGAVDYHFQDIPGGLLTNVNIKNVLGFVKPQYLQNFRAETGLASDPELNFLEWVAPDALALVKKYTDTTLHAPVRFPAIGKDEALAQTFHTTITPAFFKDEYPYLYLKNSYASDHASAGLTASPSPLAVSATGIQYGAVAATPSSAPSVSVGTFGIVDGSVEKAGALDTSLTGVIFKKFGNVALDTQIQNLNALDIYWDVTGDVRLRHEGNNTALELRQTVSNGTSVSQSMALPDRANSVDFDLGVLASGSSDTLDVLYNGALLSSVNLTVPGAAGHYSIPLSSNVAPDGDVVFRLSGPNTASVITLDNLVIGVTPNHAPALAHTELSFPTIESQVNSVANPGILVSDILGGISDVDPGALQGIAAVGVNSSAGTLQFSLDGGATWSTATVSPSQALLLAPDNLTRIRIVPQLGFSGTVSDAVTFRAWDQTTGLNALSGEYADTTTNGGSTAFSSATDTVSIRITDTTAPTLRSINRSFPAGQFTNLTSVTFLATFSEPVTGVNTNVAADFALPNAAMTGGKIGIPTTSNGGLTWSIPVTGLSTTANGAVQLNLMHNTGISDLSTNELRTSTFIGQAYTLDHTAPTVTNVTSTKANGTYRAGTVIDITVTLSESVAVTGTPQIRLETGTIDRTASYISGSGTSTLTFRYTVQAGDKSKDLNYTSTTALFLNGGTIRDAAQNNATLTLPAPTAAGSLGVNKNLTVDTVAPTVTNVTSTKANGTYRAGTVIDITVTLSESVAVTGTPQIRLETGTIDRTASYISGSGTSTLTFRYTVQAGDKSKDLNYTSTTALFLNGGTIRDAAQNNATLTLPALTASGALAVNKNLVVDTTAPAVTNVSSTKANGAYGPGNVIDVTVTFGEMALVTGTPQIRLETGTIDRTASYISGSGTSTLTFRYTVQAGDKSNDLNYTSTTALFLNGGTIRDAAQNNATLTLPALTASGALAVNKNLVVDTTAPAVTNVSSTKANGAYGPGSVIDVTVTFGEMALVTGTPQILLETGAIDRTASYISGSGTSTLTFRYTVQAGDKSNDLNYTSTTALFLNGGTIRDAAQNNATLTLPALTASGALAVNKNLVVDTVVPTVTNVTPGNFTNSLGGGQTFIISLPQAPTTNVVIAFTVSSSITAGARAEDALSQFRSEAVVAPTAADATLSRSHVTFTPTNWNVPQSVTVMGNDDGGAGFKPVTVHATVSSQDPAYSGAKLPDQSFTNITGLVRVYNLVNTDVNVHFYTTNKRERDALVSLINNTPSPHHPWKDDSSTYLSFALFNKSPGGSNVGYVQRLYNSQTSEHYYTTSLAEATALANTPREAPPGSGKFVAGWIWENRSQSEVVTSTNSFQGYMYLPRDPAATSTDNPVGPPGTSPVFRMYESLANRSQGSGDHTLTGDPAQYSVLRSRSGWTEHSMVGFAIQISSLSTASRQSALSQAILTTTSAETAAAPALQFTLTAGGACDQSIAPKNPSTVSNLPIAAVSNLKPVEVNESAGDDVSFPGTPPASERDETTLPDVGELDAFWGSVSNGFPEMWPA